MVTTEQQSLVLVKKLLAIAVSSITYLRGLFPDEAYGTNNNNKKNTGSSSTVAHMADGSTKKASILLVRKLYMLMQNLGSLPDNVCISMNLTYYDEVTPQDYQPPGFKEGGSDIMVFEKEPVKLCIGEVVTPFHTLSVDITTERGRLEQMDTRVEVVVENSSSHMEVVAPRMKTRSGRVVSSSMVSQFELPNSQEVTPSSAPKKRKFSEPKEQY
ncbi:hypothetical protein CRUP_033969 [Coryphaenoides rupestris]|nr:hypothetical protein CRUP_033969 [Coryphaenoides rupestris]